MNTSALWTDQFAIPSHLGSHALPPQADVAIVGGGYTGLSAARQLARLGARPVVLERNAIGWGASSRNGGMTTTGLKQSPQVLMRRYGSGLGRELWQASLDCITCVENIIREENIECDFARCGSLALAYKPAHYEAMCRASDWMARELGYERENIPRAELAREIGTPVYHGGVLDRLSGGLHPAKFVAGLAEAAARAGARLCASTDVRAIERRDGAFHVTTSVGDLRANEVLIATNGYTDGLIPSLRRGVIPIGSYIIATEPLPAALREQLSPHGRMFFDTKWFLYYFRLTPDGRMLFGGRASLSTDLDLTQSSRRLRQAMTWVYPQLREVKITHSWTGHLGLTFDALPHIGRVDGLHYALGYSGHGVALATYLGQQVAELLAGRRTTSPFLQVPLPTRFFYRARPWFLPLLSAGLRAMDWLM